MAKKVSELVVQDIANYLRLSEVSSNDTDFLTQCLEIAKSYVKNYTGVKDLDEQAEFVICIYLLCQEMYDNRALTVDNSQLNRVFDTILGMHNRNLL